MSAAESSARYREVLGYLEGFTNYERVSDVHGDIPTLGLGRMGYLLDHLDHPECSCPVVHIAGTKGKGSTAIMTAALLSASGYRVGLYTSPHLLTVRERIAIDGKAIGRKAFCAAFERVQPAIEALAEHAAWRPATYFEIMTALAFTAFAQAQVDVAVVEVGLGGRCDATNTVAPVVCGITTVSLDHVQQLGDTLEAIAAEKAGIIKADTPVLSAPQTPEVLAVLREVAVAKGAELRCVGSDAIGCERLGQSETRAEGQRLALSSWRVPEYGEIFLPVLGAHQAENAALALGLVETFLEARGAAPLTGERIGRAWRSLVLPARVQVVGRQPRTVLDGAHNPASAWSLAETVRESFAELAPKVFLVGVVGDKDAAAMLRVLAPLADVLVLTTAPGGRGRAAAELAALPEAQCGGNCVAVPDVLPALQEARRAAGPNGLLVVTGSFYLAGSVRALLLGEAAEGG